MASPERLYGVDRVCYIVDRMVMMVHKSNNMYVHVLHVCVGCSFLHALSIPGK
jgi:hypothetical protein